jgi:hypothetical protein
MASIFKTYQDLGSLLRGYSSMNQDGWDSIEFQDLWSQQLVEERTLRQLLRLTWQICV